MTQISDELAMHPILAKAERLAAALREVPKNIERDYGWWLASLELPIGNPVPIYGDAARLVRVSPEFKEMWDVYRKANLGSLCRDDLIPLMRRTLQLLVPQLVDPLVGMDSAYDPQQWASDAVRHTPVCFCMDVDWLRCHPECLCWILWIQAKTVERHLAKLQNDSKELASIGVWFLTEAFYIKMCLAMVTATRKVEVSV